MMKRKLLNHDGGDLSYKLLFMIIVASVFIQLGCNAKVDLAHNEADSNSTSNLKRDYHVLLGQVRNSAANSQDRDRASPSIERVSQAAGIKEADAATIASDQDTDKNSSKIEMPAPTVIDPPDDAAIEAEVNDLSDVKLTIENKLLPKDRPDWVTAADSYEGDLHTLTITTPTEESVEECNEKFPEVAYQRFVVYAKEKMNVDLKSLPKVTPQWVASRTLSEEYRFYMDRSVDGVLTYSGWAKMQISAETRAEVRELFRQSRWFERSSLVGTLFIGMVLLFGMLHVGFHFITGKKPSM